MFYTYGFSGRSKIYLSNLEDTVRAAVRMQLKLGKPIHLIAVYECLTDRIRYQFCETCGKATEWEWNWEIYDTQRVGRGSMKIAIPGVKQNGPSRCKECGANCALCEVNLDGAGDVMEQLAFLFELDTNVAFQPSHLLQDLQRKRGWERMTVHEVGQWYILKLKMKGVRFNFTPINQTVEGYKILKSKIRGWIEGSRKDELRMRLMDANAVDGKHITQTEDE